MALSLATPNKQYLPSYIAALREGALGMKLAKAGQQGKPIRPLS